MLAEGLQSVLRTSWGESAACWFERRYADLIEPYQEDEWRNRDFPKNLQESVHLLWVLIVDGLSSQ